MLFLLARVFSVGHRRHIAILLTIVLISVLGGGALFALTDHQAFTTGVYWAITTATTVGYGDVTPHNPASRLIAVVVMLTTIPLLAATFALLTGSAAANGIRRILAMRDHLPGAGFRLVLGMSRAVPAILTELIDVGDPVVLVADVEQSEVPAGVLVIKGDPTQQSVIRAARPQDAQQALITAASDGDVLVIAVLLRKEAPELPVTALVSSRSVRDALADLGIPQTIAGPELIAHTLAKSLEAPHAADMLTHLVESDRHKLTEVTADPAVVGRPLSAIRDEHTGLVLGLVRDGQFALGVSEDPVIAAGDLLLIAEPAGA